MLPEENKTDSLPIKIFIAGLLLSHDLNTDFIFLIALLILIPFPITPLKSPISFKRARALF
jgi:hypothetical protein